MRNRWLASNRTNGGVLCEEEKFRLQRLIDMLMRWHYIDLERVSLSLADVIQAGLASQGIMMNRIM